MDSPQAVLGFLGDGDLNISAALTGSVSGRTIRKWGAGKLTISGAFTAAVSPLVEGGTLAFLAPAHSTSTATVNTGATLSGDGSIDLQMTVAGQLAPGNPVGTLTAGKFVFNAGASLSLDLSSAAQYDRLATQIPAVGFAADFVFNAAVDLQITLGAGFDPVDNVDLFTIGLNGGTNAVTHPAGTGMSYFGRVLTEGAEFTVAGQPFRLSYIGGDGNDITIRAIPEPGEVMLLAVGVGAMGLVRRRRL